MKLNFINESLTIGAIALVTLGQNGSAFRNEGHINRIGRVLAVGCVSQIDYVNICSDRLLSDAAGDQLISQLDYAAFVGSSSCLLISQNYNDTKLQECLNSSQQQFSELPLAMELDFVRAVCSHVSNKTGVDNNCLSNIVKYDMNGNLFGFKIPNRGEALAALKSEINDLCSQTYEMALSANYVNKCNNNTGGSGLTTTPAPSGTAVVNFSYEIRTDGVDARALMTGTGPDNNCKWELVNATKTVLSKILRQVVHRRKLSAWPVGITDKSLRISQSKQLASSRRLISYNPDTVVEITDALDKNCNDPPSKSNYTKCVVVMSMITVTLDSGDIEQTVQTYIISGLRKFGIHV